MSPRDIPDFAHALLLCAAAHARRNPRRAVRCLLGLSL